MSHHKIWKQVSHIKGTQIADNQSVISHSRSSASYHFNHVRFSRIVEDKGTTNKKALQIESILKAKSKQLEKNAESRQRKTSRQNSIASFIDKQPNELAIKLKFNRNIEDKLTNFLQNIKQIHKQLKELAQSIVITFEQMKGDLEGNLVKVTDEMLKMNGEMKNVEKIHEIFHNGFESIRKSFVLPLQQLGQFKGVQQHTTVKEKSSSIKRRNTARQTPLTPHLKSSNQQRRRTDLIQTSAFSSQLISPPPQFKLQRLDLHSISKSKAKAETERKRKEQTRVEPKSPEETTEHRKNELNTFRSTESTQNIECIINQMREILNQ